MAKCFVDDTSLTAIAEAIRTKGGTTDQLVFPTEFISAIEAIEAGGGFDFGGTAIEFASGSFTPSEQITCKSMFSSSNKLDILLNNTSSGYKERGRWFVLWDSTPDTTKNSSESDIYSNAATNQILGVFQVYVYSANDRYAGAYIYKSSSSVSGGYGYWFGDYNHIFSTDDTRFFAAGRTYQWVAWATKTAYE